MIGLVELAVADWPRWRELRLAALTEAPQAFGTNLAEWLEVPAARWEGRLAEADLNLVAELDGRDAGMVSATLAGAGTAKLRSMWVAPFARGRGVGDALIEAVVRWAAERGAHRVTLDVMADNESAAALYRRHGFVETGTFEDEGVVERVMVRVAG
ncbi:GNAT family N-acetyltransferase [Crossiella cryophila]|uniref:Ribosomal protein S18 acetylase RimI-like enzyme n=1 Tax=Crossiella cryophila TaxID=43355 RepID=A0A7W7C9G9_9PSEU|nr:GNAT family N-acetyltransferase [Crossiella cryophila]MBB4677023.1 ribosomal protein S18 acetylase RimI-like enzyme [Crossiella cryophila]